MPVRSNPFGKVHRVEALQQLVNTWKNAGEKVVFTNGVFDLIHPGHVLYLQEAANLGSKLIVGLNSDSSVRRLNKGPHRPINGQDDRAIVLGALQAVDAICIFEEDTPLSLIQLLLPHVLVKGGDYELHQIVGANEVMDNGGEVRSLRFVEGYSTTNIEQKIRSMG